MNKLLLDAAQEGYNVKAGTETLAAQLEGGKSRFRRTQLGAAAQVSVVWRTTSDGWAYLQAFYRLRTAHGSSPFLLDIIWDSGVMETYQASFMPGTLELNSVNGTAYTAQAQLEIVPAAEDPAADLALILAYEASL